MLRTERLVLRQLEPHDADFIVALLNDPDFLRFIGDRGVRNADDGRRYISDGPAASYERNGFGLYLVERLADGRAIGICGLLRREGLDDPDLGFAFLPEFRGRGYAREAAAAAISHGRDAAGLNRLLAITSLHNHRSMRLLEDLGFSSDRTMRLGTSEEEVRLFVLDLAMPATPVEPAGP